MDSLPMLVFALLIWVLPVVTGIIVAKKKNRSPHWFWFAIYPGAGFIVLIVMLCLKPVEICEDCKKKIPAQAKVCPYCGKETLFASKTEEEKKALKKKQIGNTIIALVIAFIIAAIFLTFVTLTVNYSFKNCEPYTHSIELIKENPEIMEYLGEDFKQKGMISGSLKSSANSSGSAVISYKLKGENGISLVYVKAVKENGIWAYKEISFYKEPKSSEVINLLSE